MKSNGVDFEHTGSGQKAGELTPDVIKGRVPTATWAGATVGEHKTVSRSRRVQTVQLTGSRILGSGCLKAEADLCTPTRKRDWLLLSEKVS